MKSKAPYLIYQKGKVWILERRNGTGIKRTEHSSKTRLFAFLANKTREKAFAMWPFTPEKTEYPVPKFNSPEEEDRYWQTHSPLEEGYKGEIFTPEKEN